LIDGGSVQSKSVVTKGGVTASPSTTMFSGADNGTWTAGDITYQLYAKLQVGSANVIHTASCTFSFAGSNSSSGATVTGTETVELKAKSTVLQKAGSSVIVDGDSASGTVYGNKLQAKSSNRLKTE
jgi:hypothetical protein